MNEIEETAFGAVISRLKWSNQTEHWTRSFGLVKRKTNLGLRLSLNDTFSIFIFNHNEWSDRLEIVFVTFPQFSQTLSTSTVITYNLRTLYITSSKAQLRNNKHTSVSIALIVDMACASETAFTCRSTHWSCRSRTPDSFSVMELRNHVLLFPCLRRGSTSNIEK